MNVIVHIRNNETGEIREHPTTLMEDVNGTPGPWLWQWVEDGHSCDCNRSLLWGEEWDSEFFQPPCTDGGYNVKIVETATGKVLHDEFDRPFQDALSERVRRLRHSIMLYRDDEPGAEQAWLDAHPENEREQ
jgi:hypothetical protein